MLRLRHRWRDCDDRDRHVFDTPLYTSGVNPSCQPAVYQALRMTGTTVALAAVLLCRSG